ncbi:DNA/RNA non-specific endonuclease [Prevotella ihumii]|uniref:DNA/RNA non-specific endonuclease n=1 Tax=Prevotella ihumii TaxID=1917878 RepID=UPI0009816AB3|nr:DNA/RNA non-specific endonuclease [Prevotella ihumii]
MKINRLAAASVALLFATSAAFIACSKENEGINNKQAQAQNNSNSNFKETNPITHRVEFPRVKGGKSIIVTHTLSDGEVNFSLEWDGEKRSNRWTCYQQYASNSKTNTGRWQNKQNQYPSDPKIPYTMAFSDDHFYGSGYDHGHLCPSADRLNSKEANRQTFFISNMQPQLKKFNGSDANGGIWLTMEHKMRAALNINSKDTMFVCRGGTIDKENQIKEHRRDGFIVPGYYFSTAVMKYYDAYRNKWEYKAIAFWFEHKNNQDKSLKPYVISIDELEQLTGIDFFCNLPDDIENKIEAADKESMIKVWNII